MILLFEAMFDIYFTNTLTNVAITRFHIFSYVGVMKKQLRTEQSSSAHQTAGMEGEEQMIHG